MKHIILETKYKRCRVGWRKNQSDSQKGYPKLEDYFEELKEYEMAGFDILLQFNESAAPPGIYNHGIATHFRYIFNSHSQQAAPYTFLGRPWINSVKQGVHFSGSVLPVHLTSFGFWTDCVTRRYHLK